MMFETLGVTKHDATIVEIEGGAHPWIGLDGFPLLPMAINALDDNDRLLVNMFEELQKEVMLFDGDTSQFYWECGMRNDVGRVATSLKPMLIVVGQYHARLSPVGQPEVEPS